MAIQRNRLLLEAVYPNEIEKKQTNQAISSLFGNRDFIELYEGKGANATPNWKYQYHKVYLPTERAKQIEENLAEDVKNFRVPSISNLSLEKTNEFSVEGILVLTGSMNSKKQAFVFFKAISPEIIDVPNDLSEEDVNKHLVNRFNDDDQLTQWQKSAFQKDKPEKDSRKRDGLLSSGEPVFFLREGENNRLSFFGRARMFRLPYLKTPLDFVPNELRKAEQIDFAESIFGYTKKAGDGKAKAFSSKVFVTDARLKPNQSNIFLPNIVPSILASPKPTAFQHYLVQTTDVKDNLFHYGNKTPDETVIRGHKLYWHRGKISENDIKVKPNSPNVDGSGKVDEFSKVHTQFTPVKPDILFEFKVYFENLSNEELGALCWVLKPQGETDKTYYQKIGMGKAFGMGAVHLEADFYLENRVSRYTTLFSENNWEKSNFKADVEKWKCFSDAFEKKILTETQSDKNTLCEVERIKMLLKILEWKDEMEDENIKTTSDFESENNDFKERRVLPNPLFTNRATIRKIVIPKKT
jgi:CRISPR-associated protein (TIGR03986 family)